MMIGNPLDMLLGIDGDMAYIHQVIPMKIESSSDAEAPRSRLSAPFFLRPKESISYQIHKECNQLPCPCETLAIAAFHEIYWNRDRWRIAKCERKVALSWRKKFSVSSKVHPAIRSSRSSQPSFCRDIYQWGRVPSSLLHVHRRVEMNWLYVKCYCDVEMARTKLFGYEVDYNWRVDLVKFIFAKRHSQLEECVLCRFIIPLLSFSNRRLPCLILFQRKEGVILL